MAMEAICPIPQVHAGKHLKLHKSRAFIGSFMFALAIYFVMAFISYYVSFEPCRHTIRQQPVAAEGDYNYNIPKQQLNDPTAFGDGDHKCAGRLIYIYDLPPRFNTELVQRCNGE